MSIFVTIASYRDPQLIGTILDALEKAKYPKDIYFGIVAQTDDEQEIEFLENLQNTKLIVIKPKESRGTCYSRSLATRLYNNEDYTLQIDSHMKFAPNWDENLITQLKSCGDKAILSSYVPGWSEDEDKTVYEENIGYKLAANEFSDWGSLLFIPKDWINFDKPLTGAFWSAHFSFSEGNLFEVIPYDPNLFFYGEEITFAVRAWTHGYNLFQPNKTYVFHRYTHDRRSTFWDEHPEWQRLDLLSQKRVRVLLGIEIDKRINFGNYGLGKERTLEAYQQFSGINFKTWHIDDSAKEGIFRTYR